MSDAENPLLSPSPLAWERLIEAVDPAALLFLIDQRMSAALRAHHSAEDVLQEALLQAWTSRAECEWRGLRSFRSWILSIVEHRLLDLAEHALAQKRGGGVRTFPFSALEGGDSGSSVGPGFPTASTTPSRLAMYREQAEAIRAAIDTLPEDVRDVVRLRLIEQRQLEEISAATGLTVDAVRHRCRKGSALYARRLQAALGSRLRGTGPDSSPPGASDSSQEHGSPRAR